MKKHLGSLIGLCLFAGLGFSGSGTVAAQNQQGQVTPPPKVLVVMREMLKPGKSGSLHQKSESAFVQAFTQAQWPTHYLAMDSMSGKSRALFFVGYDSFAAWQKDVQDMMKNPTLSGAVDSAMQADGELLNSYESSTFVFRDGLSLHPGADLPRTRYFEITVFNIRPGHDHDFEVLAKMYANAFQKANIADAHWDTFQDMYGAESGGKYVVITPMKSMAEIDRNMASDKQFASSMGPDDMKKMADLAAATIKSSETNLFMVNPKMSYAADSWKTADPDFWGQK